MKYPLILTPDDGNTFLVTSPDFPELTSFGEGEVDALKNGALALQEAIAGRLISFTEIPQSSAGDHLVHVPLALALKIELYWALADAGMTRADLMRATGWPRTKVDRLFNPNNETRLAQIEEAFAVLNRTVTVELEAT